MEHLFQKFGQQYSLEYSLSFLQNGWSLEINLNPSARHRF